MLWACAALTALLIVIKNPLVLAILATDGVLAVAVIVAATLGGLTLLPLVRLGRLPWREQLLYGAGLGLGLVATTVMLLGWAGLLHRALWIALLAVAAAAGAVRSFRLSAAPCPKPRTSVRADAHTRPTPPALRRDADASPGSPRWLWLIVCPFLALTVLVACVPPGHLWAEEGNGYDVLEYHLQMPKEYLEAGRVFYARHNVYANFPANVEMLYLLGMILRGRAIEAAVTCQLLNAGLAILTVAAAWMAGRRHGPTTGLISAVVAAGVDWLTYLSGVAYVENGMLLFGMLACSALTAGIDASNERRGWWALAGVLAGLAVGCKYIAGVLIGLPMTVALFFCLRASLRRKVLAVCIFAATQAIAFAPWAVKNAVMTGNPVFPLANQVFQAFPPGWGTDESRHFAAAHATLPGERGIASRLKALWRHVPGDADQRFGALLLTFAIWGAIERRRDRTARFHTLTALLQIPLWLGTTHLYARFAVPLLIPLVQLAGRVSPGVGRRRTAVIALLLLGSAVNLGFLNALYLRHMVPGGRRLALEGVTEYFTEGAAPGLEYLEIVNGQLPSDARVLLVGDAKAFYFRRAVDYCVVFNRSPFVEAVRRDGSGPGLINWLTAHGYTHVLVNWAEIRRLRRSAYGFPEEITPALFDRLVAAGLEQVGPITSRISGREYARLYRVPAHTPE